MASTPRVRLTPEQRREREQARERARAGGQFVTERIARVILGGDFRQETLAEFRTALDMAGRGRNPSAQNVGLNPLISGEGFIAGTQSTPDGRSLRRRVSAEGIVRSTGQQRGARERIVRQAANDGFLSGARAPGRQSFRERISRPPSAIENLFGSTESEGRNVVETVASIAAQRINGLGGTALDPLSRVGRRRARRGRTGRPDQATGPSLGGITPVGSSTILGN